MTDDERTSLIVPATFTGTLDRPKSLDSHDLTGTEGIGVDDVRLPRLAIAQGLSPQMMPDDSTYIPGLTLFSLFNDLTGDKYGNGPVTFVPIRRDVRRIEFHPRELGGGIVDLDVPIGDARLRWTVDNGQRIPPKATSFDEYVILLLLAGKTPEPVVLSIKGTNKFNRRAASNLNTYIKMRHAAIYAGLYTIATKSEKNDSGTFGVYVVRNAGFVPTDTPTGHALFEFAADFARSLEGKQIVVEREASTADEFDPEVLEREESRIKYASEM